MTIKIISTILSLICISSVAYSFDQSRINHKLSFQLQSSYLDPYMRSFASAYDTQYYMSHVDKPQGLEFGINYPLSSGLLLFASMGVDASTKRNRFTPPQSHHAHLLGATNDMAVQNSNRVISYPVRLGISIPFEF